MHDIEQQVAQVWAEVFDRAGTSAYGLVIEQRPAGAGEPTWQVRERADLAFSGASMIKSFLAEMVSADVASGRLDWHQVVRVTPEHLTVGDGVLGGWQMPAPLALHDVVHLMITISDNSATNTIAELLGGTEAVNDRIMADGYRSRFRRWVGSRHPDPRNEHWVPDAELPSPAGLSIVTAADHARLLDQIKHDRRHQLLWGLFEAQQDRTRLVRHLDDRLAFGRKTGTVDGVRHEGGILDLPDGTELAISVFTDHTDAIERVDHPSCVAMGLAMVRTLDLLGHGRLVIVRPDGI